VPRDKGQYGLMDGAVSLEPPEDDGFLGVLGLGFGAERNGPAGSPRRPILTMMPRSSTL
jgi:hypothetical protein